MAVRKLLVPTGVLLLKLLSTTLLRGEEPVGSSEWREVVNLEGNFRVLLPGKATTFKTNEPLEDYGIAERQICLAEARRGGAVASFLATSVKEPGPYLDRFTPAERIQRLREATVADCRKSFPDAELTVDLQTRDVQNYSATCWKITLVTPNKWLEVQTLAFYADGVFHAAEVLHFSQGPARAVNEEQVEKFFDSYALLVVPKLETLAKRVSK